MIAIGGTPLNNSNRMKESSEDLDHVTEISVFSQFKESLKLGIPAIKKNLKDWKDLDYHLVGSRGYVYQSKKLIEVIEGLERAVERNSHDGVFELTHLRGGNLLPRTFGLRKTVINHILKTGV